MIGDVGKKKGYVIIEANIVFSKTKGEDVLTAAYHTLLTSDSARTIIRVGWGIFKAYFRVNSGPPCFRLLQPSPARPKSVSVSYYHT